MVPVQYIATALQCIVELGSAPGTATTTRGNEMNLDISGCKAASCYLQTAAVPDSIYDHTMLSNKPFFPLFWRPPNILL